MGFGADVADWIAETGFQGDLCDAVDHYMDPGLDPEDYDYFDADGGFEDSFNDGNEYGSDDDDDDNDDWSSREFKRRLGGWPLPASSHKVFAPQARKAARSGTQARPLGVRKKTKKTRMSSKPNPSASAYSDKRAKHVANSSGAASDSLGSTESADASTLAGPSLSSADVKLEKVLFHNSLGRPIDFGTDPETTEKLLDVMSNFKKHEERLLKQVKEEPGSDEDAIQPDDSVSNVGVQDFQPHRKHSSRVRGRISEVSGSSARSVTTSLSLLSVAASADDGRKGRCFLATALFQTPDGRLVQAGQLRTGASVVAANGATTRVKTIGMEPPHEQEIIELVAGASSNRQAILKVTPSHRVMVLRGHAAQTMPAGNLQEGDFVFSNEGKTEELVLVRRVSLQVEIVEITFSPDEAVAAFEAPPPAILSKGHGWAKTRRSKRHNRHEQDHLSIPDTEDSFN